MNAESKPKSKLKNGKSNPEYYRWYREKRKAEGIPLSNPEYYRQYRKTEKGKAIMDAWGKSDRGKAAMKKYRDSEKGKAARKRYYETSLKKPESAEKYAERIARKVDAMQSKIARNEERMTGWIIKNLT